MAEKQRRGVEVHSWDEVPQFSSEADEAEWWETHSLGDELLEEMKPAPLSADEQTYLRSRTRPVGVRFDESTLSRLKRLAARKHKGYQTLLKEFVVERLYEEEKREGLVGTDSNPTAMRVDDHGHRQTSSRTKRARLYSRWTSMDDPGHSTIGL